MLPFVQARSPPFEQDLMSNKLNVASGIAVAATLATALFGTGETGASAVEMVPVLVSESIQQKPASAIETRSTLATIAEAESPARTQAAEPVEAVVPAIAAPAATLAQHVRAQPKVGALDREMRCLAGAIYFEARGESLDGQLAVGRVVVERANSGRFPNSYCGVVYQPSQFSFVRGRSMPAIRESSPAWSRAVAMARIADQGSWDSPTEGALFFHATHVSPKWRLKRLARIDNHVFYR